MSSYPHFNGSQIFYINSSNLGIEKGSRFGLCLNVALDISNLNLDRFWSLYPNHHQRSPWHDPNSISSTHFMSIRTDRDFPSIKLRSLSTSVDTRLPLLLAWINWSEISHPPGIWSVWSMWLLHKMDSNWLIKLLINHSALSLAFSMNIPICTANIPIPNLTRSRWWKPPYPVSVKWDFRCKRRMNGILAVKCLRGAAFQVLNFNVGV